MQQAWMFAPEQINDADIYMRIGDRVRMPGWWVSTADTHPSMRVCTHACNPKPKKSRAGATLITRTHAVTHTYALQVNATKLITQVHSARDPTGHYIVHATSVILIHAS